MLYSRNYKKGEGSVKKRFICFSRLTAPIGKNSWVWQSSPGLVLQTESSLLWRYRCWNSTIETAWSQKQTWRSIESPKSERAFYWRNRPTCNWTWLQMSAEFHRLLEFDRTTHLLSVKIIRLHSNFLSDIHEDFYATFPLILWEVLKSTPFKMQMKPSQNFFRTQSGSFLFMVPIKWNVAYKSSSISLKINLGDLEESYQSVG